MNYYSNEYRDPQAEPVQGADTCGKCVGDTEFHSDSCGEYPTRSQARAEIESVLGHDTDALRAELEDLGL